MRAQISHISRKTKEMAFFIAATVFLVTGIIGIFLPVLPTTPFLLLAAYCYSRGSKKFHHWLINHRFLGPPIRDWEKNHAISKKAKVFATVTMAGSSIIVLFIESIPVVGKGAYVVVLGSVLAYIWTRPDSQ